MSIDPAEMWCPSVDVCAFCTDVYCDGIACIAELDPNSDRDSDVLEQLHAWIRAGRVFMAARRFHDVTEGRPDPERHHDAPEDGAS